MAVDIPLDDFGANLTVTGAEEVRYGDNQLYAKDLTIDEGENAVLQLGYNSLTDLHEYSATVTLPEGVTVISVEYASVLTDKSYITDWSFADGALTLTGEQSGSAKKPKPAEAGDHIFATVSLNTSALAAGSYDIVVGGQYISNEDDDEDGEHYPADYTAYLTVRSAAASQTPCAAPIIGVTDEGDIFATCATPGATIHTTISTDDQKTVHVASGETVPLSGQYLITAYATADDHADSKPTTVTLAWVKSNHQTTRVESVKADTERPVLVYSDGDCISIKGAEPGETVAIYSLSGLLLYEGKADAAAFTIPLYCVKGDLYIIAIGDRSIKHLF